jgi:hypothetical protein
VPAELLRLAGGALRDADVDEGGAAVVHRLIEGATEVLRVFDPDALAAGAFPGEGPGASIILSWRAQQYQTLRTGPGYWATIGSAVSSRMPSTADCATSMRSNGSLWIGGRLAIATACSLVIASSP